MTTNTYTKPAPGANMKAAFRLADAGFAIFPAKASDRTPHVRKWQKVATADLDQIGEWWERWPDAIPALPTGRRNGVAVLDVDMKNDKDGLADLKALGLDPDALSASVVITPRGGRHIYFQHEEGLRTTAGTIAPGLDVRAEGGYVIAPGAEIEQGVYKAIGTPLDREIIRLVGSLPTWRNELRPRQRERSTKAKGEKTGRPFPIVREALFAMPNAGENEWQSRDYWRDAGMALHFETDGSAEGLEAFEEWSQQHPTYDPGRTVEAWDSFKLDRGDDRLLTGWHILNKAREHGWHDLEHIFALFASVEPEGGYPDDRRGGSMAVMDDDRFGAPIMQGDKIVINLHNTTLSLYRNLDSILPDLRRNEMTGRDEWSGGQVDDEALSMARVKLELLGLKTVGKDLVAEAIPFVARHRCYHPIRDALARVEWDGKRRLETWLIRLAGAEDSPYVRAVGRKFLIQMVARVMQPGCKADHVLVLSGPQNQGKSALFRILAGDYFSDGLPAINGGKDTLIHLRGKWLIEIAELASMRKSAAEELKAFLTTTVDSYRPPYGRTESAWPRQCVFAGTTNEDEFLNDPTGGRRFWPVTIPGVIDTDGVAAERDQLFAEALAAFNAGEPWWLDREFEAQHAKPMQDAARVSDTWSEIVAEWLEKPIDRFGEAEERRMEVTIRDVLHDALTIAPERQNSHVQRRAAAIIRGLGWIKSHKRSGNIWRRPEE